MNGQWGWSKGHGKGSSVLTVDEECRLMTESWSCLSDVCVECVIHSVCVVTCNQVSRLTPGDCAIRGG